MQFQRPSGSRRGVAEAFGRRRTTSRSRLLLVVAAATTVIIFGLQYYYFHRAYNRGVQQAVTRTELELSSADYVKLNPSPAAKPKPLTPCEVAKFGDARLVHNYFCGARFSPHCACAIAHLKNRPKNYFVNKKLCEGMKVEQCLSKEAMYNCLLFYEDDIFASRGLHQVKAPGFKHSSVLYWNVHMLPYHLLGDAVDDYQPSATQIVGWIPTAKRITDKGHLCRSSLLAEFGPRCFMIPDHRHQFAAFAKKVAADAHPKNSMLIVKGIAMASGFGTNVVDVRDAEIVRSIQNSSAAVVQEYIHPHLIYGLKYDLRFWILVSGVSPVRAYLHERSVIRFASKPYDSDPEHFRDYCMHLTNTVQQKRPECQKSLKEHLAKFPAFESRVWHTDRWMKYLKQNNVDGWDLFRHRLEQRIGEMISVSLPNLENEFKYNVMESNYVALWAVDVAVDEDLMPYVLEVNESPVDWGAASGEYKAPVLDDMISLLGLRGYERDSYRDRTQRLLHRVCKCGSSTAKDDSRIDCDDAAIKFIQMLEDEKENLGGFVPIFPTENVLDLAYKHATASDRIPHGESIYRVLREYFKQRKEVS